MLTEPLNVPGFLRNLLDRGWHWSEGDDTLLVHPGDHALGVRYDPQTEKLTASPELDEQIKLIIPTPASKGRFRG